MFQGGFKFYKEPVGFRDPSLKVPDGFVIYNHSVNNTAGDRFWNEFINSFIIFIILNYYVYVDKVYRLNTESERVEAGNQSVPVFSYQVKFT